jgi:hypothetical protein
MVGQTRREAARPEGAADISILSGFKLDSPQLSDHYSLR